MLRGPFQKLMHLRKARARAGGALQTRLGEEGFGARRLVFRFEQVLQLLRVVARGGARDADQSRAQRAQKPHQIRITGIVDQHHIARLYEAARRQFQTLARAMREQHLSTAHALLTQFGLVHLGQTHLPNGRGSL